MKTIVGSPIYMAPQMIQSVVNCVRSTKTKYTSKCDIWSFGVVAYELVTGTIPWKIKTCSHKELL
jgi:serine/threonine protein kinase